MTKGAGRVLIKNLSSTALIQVSTPTYLDKLGVLTNILEKCIIADEHAEVVLFLYINFYLNTCRNQLVSKDTLEAGWF